jgi:putative protein-disulfide isomerase
MHQVSTATLYLIVDPLCGWTYAAQPIFKQAQQIQNLNIQVFSGGMLAFHNKRIINKNWQKFVTPNDQRIADLSGMPFGDEYRKMLSNIGQVLDSEPPAKAMIVAKKMKQSSLTMLAILQEAYFVKGLDICDGMVLSQLASAIGVEPYTFLNLYQKINAEHMVQHFNEAAKLLSLVQGKGYPTAILEVNGERELVNLNQYYGQAERWKNALINNLDNVLAQAS